MTTLVFRDPEPSKPGPRTWKRRVAELAHHPGKWVDATETWGVGRGVVQLARKHGLEAMEAKHNGETHLFVRYPSGEAS